MKKLLSITVASLAFAAVADYAAPQIGVTTITATSKNTIIPVPFKALSDGTSGITVTDLVKTNGLPNNTWLLAYNGTNYSSWQYNGGVWQASIYAGENGSIAGSLATSLVCGSALWVVLPQADSYNLPLTIYGAYATGVTSAVAAGAGESGAVASLVANPLQKAATITVTPVAGDQIIIPDEEAIYTYKVKGETGSWRKGGKSVSLPSSFAVGKGFWYVRAADGAATEISWAAVN